MKRVTATGQALIEYALILFLMISMSLILAVLGSRTAGTYQQIVNAFATPATGSSQSSGLKPNAVNRASPHEGGQRPFF